MTSLAVRHSPRLLEHLRTHVIDGSTVDAALFEGGRLMYPARRVVEQTMGRPEPYTIEYEARVLDGLGSSVRASLWLLSAEATERLRGTDPTLDLLWGSHAAYPRLDGEGPSLDRLVTALVMVGQMRDGDLSGDGDLERAAILLVRAMAALGFPPSAVSLEEIWDGAAPACVGLGLVEVG